MNILIRCLSKEAIENTISVLNYNFDKVVYFSYKKNIIECRKRIESFVKDVCHIKLIDFIELDSCTKDDIKNCLNGYLNKNNKLFFDLKGSKNTCDMIFISFADKNKLPVFTWNIPKNKIKLMNDDSSYSLDILDNRKIDITINRYIEMLGGKVISSENKFVKTNEELINKVINIRNDYSYIWSYFATLLHNHKDKSGDIVNIENIDAILDSLKNHFVTVENIYSIIERMEKDDLIKILKKDRKNVKFRYLFEPLKTIFSKSGNVFEYTVFLDNNANKYDDKCLISVTLDWDGIVRKETCDDVLNEIDVIKLDNYIMTFISCKDKHELDKECIYELQAVASKFGGKYIKKIIACSTNCNEGFINRANDLKIQVKKYC